MATFFRLEKRLVLAALVAGLLIGSLGLGAVEAKKKKGAVSTEKLEELRSLSWDADTKEGVIFLTKAEDVEGFLVGSERPYSLVMSVVLLDKMLENEGVKTQKHAVAITESLRAAVKRYRQSVAREEEDIFFVQIEFNADTQALFQKMEVQSFPTTLVVRKKDKIALKDPTFKIRGDARFTQSSKKEFFEFLEDTFSLGIFEISDEKISISVFNIVVGYTLIIFMARVLWKLAKAGLMVPLMAVGSVAVFWFSTSGIIKCIIHSLPMVIADGRGNAQVFVQDNRNQTMLEGIVMSSAYLVITLCLSLFTFFFPYVKNETVKNVGLYTTFIVGVMGYLYVLDCFEWKSHMTTRIYGWNI